MAKTIYSAVVNGVEVKRTTDRTYSHAVVWASDCGKMVKPKAFSGSLQLAQKARNQLNDGTFVKRPEDLIALGLDPEAYEVLDTNPIYRIVPGKWLIVPVVPETK
ncbi:hypothetical protein [Paenibacillus sinopodophylli]|uniref:hypothetical protein n=1 Tax=Paenibacillus sinopodophylli TaxID=1837342 RepID=UPI00110D1BE6|nr:hypothetical protein [Paenibacillus sinopodophylli]